MISKKLPPMKLLLWLSSLALGLSSCNTAPVNVIIPNATFCAVHGKIVGGGGCAESETHITRELDMDHFLDFLEAREASPDPDHAGQTLPAHAAAICQSSEDYAKLKYALDVACRDLGDHCTPEIQGAIQALGAVLKMVDQKEFTR